MCITMYLEPSSKENSTSYDSQLQVNHSKINIIGNKNINEVEQVI